MAAIKILLLSMVASGVESHFLPIREDPADALANKMIKSAGIDSADSTSGPVGKSSFPVEPEKAQSAHKRFNQHDLVKLQPIVSATGLVAPQEWKSTPDMDAPSTPLTQDQPVDPVHEQLINDQEIEQKNQMLLHAIVHEKLITESDSESPVQSETSDSEESQKSTTNTVEQELQNLKPKEVIKVFDRDTRVNEYAEKGQGLAHLGESLDKYGPIVQEKPMDPNFSLHHGHYRPTSPPTLAPPPSPSPMVASATVTPMSSSQQHHEDDLATSLRAVFPKKKSAAISDTSQDKQSGPHPAMESLHRHKKNEMQFPIRPEDVHAENTPQGGNSTSESHLVATTTTTTTTVKKTAPKQKATKHKSSVQSSTDKWTSMFDANSFAGQLNADDVEKVLRFMKVQPEWNWHPFDLNGDGKLSRQEFLNAARVAVRFKITKKK